MRTSTLTQTLSPGWTVGWSAWRARIFSVKVIGVIAGTPRIGLACETLIIGEKAGKPYICVHDSDRIQIPVPARKNMARAKNQRNGRLEEAMATLLQTQASFVQNQAAFLAQVAETDRWIAELE